LGTLLYLLLLPKIVFLNIINFIFENKIYMFVFFIIFFACIITMLFTILFTFFQVKIKKFIVYTSIFHNAFFVSLLMTNNNFSKVYLNISLIIYILLISAFLFLLSLLRKPDGQYIDTFNFLEAIANSYPLMAKFYLFIIISMAGIPPFAGFFMKYYIISIFIHDSLFFISGLLLLFSIPILYTYLRMVQLLYLKTKNKKQKNILLLPTTFSLSFTLGLMQILNIFFIKFGYSIILFFELLLVIN
jgi:NADH-quinone oxidoreductase subunit N